MIRNFRFVSNWPVWAQKKFGWYIPLWPFYKSGREAFRRSRLLGRAKPIQSHISSNMWVDIQRRRK